MERKEAVYKGLEFIPIDFEDTSLTSPEYFQITEFPTKLTAGKNVFKLRGHPTNLKPGGVLGVEVLDYNGDPIYHQIVDFIDEDKSRAIAIYIYEETSPGDCTITLVAEAAIIEGAPTPINWQGKANVRWSRTIPVNPNITNISEIIFETPPSVTVEEIVGVQLDRSYPGTGQFPTYNTGTVRYYSSNNQPAIEILGGELTSEMKGGTLTVASPSNPTPAATYTVPSTAYVSTIKKILTTGSALLDTEYTVFSSQSISPHTYGAFDHSAFTIDYEASPVYTATQNSQSFAYIQVSGLDPAAGDVSRIKVFTNNKGTVGTWDLVNDFEIEETEILIENTASLFPDETIGLFTSQSLIDFWEANTYIGNTTTTAPSLVWYTSSLSGGAKIESSTNIANANSVHTFQVKDDYMGIFVKDSAYKVRLDAIGTRSANSNNLDPTLSIYISGSAFNFNSTDFLNQELPVNIGKKVGQLKLSGNSQRVDDKSFSFKSDNNGKGKLIFVVESGDWQLADVHILSDNDSGYTPNYTRIKTPIETTHKLGNQISFKLEYYNADGAGSKQISYIYNKNWQGGNRYIDGDYSLMTGSLYVADSLETGVAISGYPNSGFIRSLSYQGFDAGFPGFLLWSGSAMPGQTSKGVAYSGVGLELYANTESYFRYSTSDDELDIRTTKFFLGHPSSSYLSGSNGLLEISSSNFLVSSSGDVIASSGEFRGTNLADMYLFRNSTVNSNDTLLSTFNATIPAYGSREYVAINLTGSYDSSITSNGPSTFLRLEAGTDLDDHPIGNIRLHPNDSYWTTGNNYQKYGAICIIEVASIHGIFISTVPSDSNHPDAEILFDTVFGVSSAGGKIFTDDMYAGLFKEYTINGVTYPNTMLVTQGTRIVLAQSTFDWKIVALSRIDTGPITVASITLPPVHPTEITGSIISTAAGTFVVSGSGANQHAYCYLNGSWKQLD